MADQETMAAYAVNAKKYRTLVSDGDGNVMLAGFLEQLPPRASILDFGCGVGDSAAVMQAAGHEVRCQDASPQMAAMAHDLFGLKVDVMSFDQLELVAAFDAVWRASACCISRSPNCPTYWQGCTARSGPAGCFISASKRAAANSATSLDVFTPTTWKMN